MQMMQANMCTFVCAQFRYDMVPGGVLNTIQNALLTEDELAVYGTVMAVIATKLQQYNSRCIPSSDSTSATAAKQSSSSSSSAAAAAAVDDVGADALAVATALVQEERRFLKDLNEQLRKECLLLGDDDDDDQEDSDTSDGDSDSDAAAASSKKQSKGAGSKRKHISSGASGSSSRGKGKGKGKGKRRR
jgi:DNA replication initiation complex subunit (GINS family)